MIEHTKGPWVARRWWEQAEMDLRQADEEEREAWLNAPYMDIYSPSAGVTVTACHDLSTMSPMDAKLLSSGPELLAALEAILLSPYAVEKKVYDAARRTINRARGISEEDENERGRR